VGGESGQIKLGRAAMRLLPAAIELKDGDVCRTVGFDLSPAQLRQFRGEAVALVFQDPMTRLNPLMTIGRHCIETLLSHQPHILQAKEKRSQLWKRSRFLPVAGVSTRTSLVEECGNGCSRLPPQPQADCCR